MQNTRSSRQLIYATTLLLALLFPANGAAQSYSAFPLGELVNPENPEVDNIELGPDGDVMVTESREYSNNQVITSFALVTVDDLYKDQYSYYSVTKSDAGEPLEWAHLLGDKRALFGAYNADDGACSYYWLDYSKLASRSYNSSWGFMPIQLNVDEAHKGKCVELIPISATQVAFEVANPREGTSTLYVQDIYSGAVERFAFDFEIFDIQRERTGVARVWGTRNTKDYFLFYYSQGLGIRYDTSLSYYKGNESQYLRKGILYEPDVQGFGLFEIGDFSAHSSVATRQAPFSTSGFDVYVRNRRSQIETLECLIPEQLELREIVDYNERGFILASVQLRLRIDRPLGLERVPAFLVLLVPRKDGVLRSTCPRVSAELLQHKIATVRKGPRNYYNLVAHIKMTHLDGRPWPNYRFFVGATSDWEYALSPTDSRLSYEARLRKMAPRDYTKQVMLFKTDSNGEAQVQYRSLRRFSPPKLQIIGAQNGYLGRLVYQVRKHTKPAKS